MIAEIKNKKDELPNDRTIYACIDEAAVLGIISRDDAEMQKLFVTSSEYWDFVGTVEECLDKLAVITARVNTAMDKYNLCIEDTSSEYND